MPIRTLKEIELSFEFEVKIYKCRLELTSHYNKVINEVLEKKTLEFKKELQDLKSGKISVIQSFEFDKKTFIKVINEHKEAKKCQSIKTKNE